MTLHGARPILASVRVALAQVNPTVGDLAGNRRLVEEAAAKAEAAGAALVVLPELALTGYPPLDLLEREGFVEDQLRELERLAGASRRVAIAVGAVLPVEGGRPKALLNAAVLLANGARAAVRGKSLLPTYDVFDEGRYFQPASTREPVRLGRPDGERLGLTVCEDLWASRVPYTVDPATELTRAGVDLLVNLSASPWHVGKARLRRELFSDTARRHGVPTVFVNQVGGNDSLVFDGSSMVLAPDGRTVARARSFEEDLILFDTETMEGNLHDQLEGEEASAYAALVLGTRDYVRKCGFRRVVIGLSGGIDSALTAAIAVDALGPENVTGLALPSQYSSEHSLRDARELACRLRIRFEVLPIAPIFDVYRKTLVLFAQQLTAP